MHKILKQLKKRRLELGLKQGDMLLRVGISRQQYQKLEADGNPRLNTLELVAKGLDSELVLIPKDKLAMVRSLVDGEASGIDGSVAEKDSKLPNDPWQGLLGDED